MQSEKLEHGENVQENLIVNQTHVNKTRNRVIDIFFIFLLLIIPIILILIYKQRMDYSEESFENTEYKTDSEKIQSPESIQAQRQKETIERVERYYKESLPDQVIYSSSELGVSFIYMKGKGDDEISVSEIDNKIYVYPTAYDVESGHYLEVFEKNADETLKEALERLFLKGYDSNECYAYTRESNMFYPEGYIVGNIQLTGDIDIDDIALRYQNCPLGYTLLNGSSAFLAERNHPERFIFISGRQYPISYDREAPFGDWQNSIRFID